MIDEKSQDIFNAYTPFRNHLRKAELEGSLRAIHAHIQHQLFGQELPGYIKNCPWGYRQAKYFKDFVMFHLFPWELEIIAKELIINSGVSATTKSLEDWQYLANAVNKLKALENSIPKIYINKSKVLLELHRIAHRQFKWQVRPNFQTLSRYWAIYNYPSLNEIIKKTIGLEIEEIYLIGLALTGFYLKKLALFYPPRINVPKIDKRKLDIFLNHFAIDFEKLKSMLIQEQQLNEKYAYAFNSINAYPLIKMKYGGRLSLVCPIPPLLYHRFASGIYYEIYSQEGFDSVFGKAFQSYIGKVLEKGTKKLQIIPESKYGKKLHKRTVDWIVKDNTAILFIECKTKRLILGAKVELNSEEQLNKELSKMADFIIQTYKTFIDYQQNKYPNLKYNEKTKTYLLITTLEEWYLFGDKLLPILEKEVTRKFKEQKLPLNVLKKYPYMVCSTSELEEAVQVADIVGINKVFEEKTKSNEARMWVMATYIAAKFPKEISKTKDLFTEELKDFLNKHQCY